MPEETTTLRNSEFGELRTVGQIAEALGVHFERIRYVLKSRTQIKPTMRVGTFRLYDAAAVVAIEKEINAIAEKRTASAQPAGCAESVLTKSNGRQRLDRAATQMSRQRISA